MSLAGNLALITGAASGIGLSTAQLFAEHGCDLVLVDISAKVLEVADEIREKFKERVVFPRVIDVTNSDQVESLFEEVALMFKKPATIVVNSAGIAKPCKLIDMSEEQFDQTVSVNLKGTFLVTKLAIKALLNAYPEVQFKNHTDSYASVINISSQAAKRGMPNVSHYSTTKAGVVGFTKALAAEYGPYRIRVNAISPYFLETPCHNLNDHPEMKEMFIKRVPLGRFGEPDEVAQLNLFLASNASSYISGADIDISGGV